MIIQEFKKYITYKIYGLNYSEMEPINSCNIYWDRDRNKYWCEILPEGDKCPETIPILIKYRLAGSLENINTPWKMPKDLSSLDSDYLEWYLSERVIPPNRDLLKQTLESEGIYEYDWRILIRLNQGRTIDDDNWIEVLEHDDPPPFS